MTYAEWVRHQRWIDCYGGHIATASLAKPAMLAVSKLERRINRIWKLLYDIKASAYWKTIRRSS